MDTDLMSKLRSVVNGDWLPEEFSDDSDYSESSDEYYKNPCCLSRKNAQGCQESRMILMERSLEADRNAQALLEEEEKEKKKLEKKRAKKRRKRGRMKARKQAEAEQAQNEDEEEEENESNPQPPPAPEETKKSKKKKNKNAEPVEDDVLDINSAFVSAVCLKTGLTPKAGAAKEKGSAKKIASETTPTAPPKIHEPTTREKVLGEQLASVGCQKAAMGAYKEAMNLFTRAIEVLPDDHRFWGNRSFCFLHLGDYKRALEDAEKAISLSPDSSKAFYRKAEVLFALKDYAGAEASFEKVLALDKDCADARADVEQVRLARLMDMGFPRKASMMAIAQHSTVQAAVEALTSGNYNQFLDNSCDDINPNNSSNPEIDENYEETLSYTEASNAPRKPAATTPTFSSKSASLWVGSVMGDVSEELLKNLFQKYGLVVSVRLLPESSCAFVNFKEPKSAEDALANLQGYSLMGRNLLIRYPNKPKDENHAYQQMVSNQAKPATATNNYSGFNNNAAAGDNISTTSSLSSGNVNINRPVKLKGPVNGMECYYWRTYGCAFGAGCRYLHIEENCGIDKKSYHK